MARMQTSMAKPRRNGGLDRLTIILIIVFVIIAIVTAVVAFNIIRNLVRGSTLINFGGVAIPTESPGVHIPPAPGATVDPSKPLDSAGPAAPPWDSTQRFNVLIMGLDYEDTVARKDPRSDTMILFTMDPLSGTAGMLSIPRDMWVNIPNGFGYAKINQAYFFGEINRMPGGGPGLAMETVTEFLGVPVNYYAVIDFDAFEKFIDAIGGIKLIPDEDLTLSLRGGPDKKVNLKAGEKVLVDGEIALGYARQRHTAGGDFDRAGRQQQVIMAIRDRVLEMNELPTLIAKAPELYNELQAGIRTNLTLDQVIRLAQFASQIKPEKITKGVLGPGMVQIAKSPDNLDILVPIPDQIRIERDRIFATGGPVGPAAVEGGDQKALIQAEAAKVELRNASTTAGLARRTSDYLKTQGVNVVAENNADTVLNQSTIIIYSGKPQTLKYLATLLNEVPEARILNQYDPNAQVDIVVNLGIDWANKNPLP